jgi:hypothetical protein
VTDNGDGTVTYSGTVTDPYSMPAASTRRYAAGTPDPGPGGGAPPPDPPPGG